MLKVAFHQEAARNGPILAGRRSVDRERRLTEANLLGTSREGSSQDALHELRPER